MKREINFIKNVFSKKPENLDFFITTKCNFRCKTCFYWKSLGKGDLSSKDIKKVIKNLPNSLRNVSLSGGEPFLRQDLPEIIRELGGKGVKSIGIPTNSSLPEVPNLVEKLLKENTEIEFLIITSLDGLEKTNDKIRMKGGFKKAMKNLEKMKKLKKKYSNLKLQIATTINSLNYRELPEFIEFVKSLDIDIHTFDWMRGEHPGILGLPPKKEIEKINKSRRDTARYYNKKKSFLHKLYSNLKIDKVIATQKRVLCGKKWTYDCLAGRTELVLEVNGDLKICELLPPIGNLIKQSFEEIINSDKAKKQFDSIKKHKCDCTHICFVSSSLDHSPLAILKMMLGQ